MLRNSGEVLRKNRVALQDIGQNFGVTLAESRNLASNKFVCITSKVT